MSSITALRFAAEPIRILASGGIGASYAAIGTAITKPARIIFIQNLTDEALMFSFDGVDDHVPLPSTGYFLVDMTTNNLYLSEYTKIYVKRIGVATTGGVYVTVIYGAQ